MLVRIKPTGLMAHRLLSGEVKIATLIDAIPLHFLLCWTGYKMKIVIIENEPRI